jgi:hypothetical protein
MPWRNFDVAGSRTSSSRRITRTRSHCHSYSQCGRGVASFTATPHSGPNYHAAPARVSKRAEVPAPGPAPGHAIGSGAGGQPGQETEDPSLKKFLTNIEHFLTHAQDGTPALVGITNGVTNSLSNSNINGFNNNPGSLTNGPFINNSSTNLNGNSFGTSNSNNKRSISSNRVYQ